MAISTRDGLIAANAGAQIVQWAKTQTRTTVAAGWFSVIDLAGSPGAGTLAGSSTAAGVVPTDATAGCPTINAFGGGNTGYITQVDFGSSVACRLRLFDMLFKAGAYAFNASTTLAAQPSYAARVPGADYTGTQIWVETVTAFTGNMTVEVTYTDQSGNAGATTGAVTVGGGVVPSVGRMFQLPLAAGDTGVQMIESVVSTVASAGTFNVLVLRPLWSGRVRINNDGDMHGPDRTGLPVVFADSALFGVVAADSTSAGFPEMLIRVANG